MIGGALYWKTLETSCVCAGHQMGVAAPGLLSGPIVLMSAGGSPAAFECIGCAHNSLAVLELDAMMQHRASVGFAGR